MTDPRKLPVKKIHQHGIRCGTATKLRWHQVFKPAKYWHHVISGDDSVVTCLRCLDRLKKEGGDE